MSDIYKRTAALNRPKTKIEIHLMRLEILYRIQYLENKIKPETIEKCKQLMAKE